MMSSQIAAVVAESYRLIAASKEERAAVMAAYGPFSQLCPGGEAVKKVTVSLTLNQLLTIRGALLDGGAKAQGWEQASQFSDALAPIEDARQSAVAALPGGHVKLYTEASSVIDDTVTGLRRDLELAKNYIDLMHRAMDELGVRDSVDQQMICIEDEELPLC